MIFKLATKELYSDDGLFIKKLYCPYLVKWQDMNEVKEAANRACNICQKAIVNTEKMNDQQVVDLIRRSPETCLKVSPNQKNITVVNIYD